MAKGRVYKSEYPLNPPEWYWEKGLHDARIVCVQKFEFPFDYGKYEREKNSYDRNLLTLKIDAKGAIYDSRVKEIRFFNYRILSDDIVLNGRNKIWWMSDRLTSENGYYILEIQLLDIDAYPEEFCLKIKFDRAEVDRD